MANWTENFLYYGLRMFFSLLLRIFFRDIEVLGKHHIPKQGAVIFVGNHANQFVDPLILLTNCSREVSFLIAAKSLRRAVIGFFAKQMKSIGIERPQDVAKNADGKIYTESSNPCQVRGINTKFTSQVSIGETLRIGRCNEAPRVDRIISDTEIFLKEPFERQVDEKGESFKVQPRLDHSTVYDSVWKALRDGKCIGIFPEGGSHDRSDLLPLKAGVTIMALGAMEKYKGTQVTIVPCGLNYFSGHKFRSMVVVEFGAPLIISEALLESYKKNKRDACADLLTHVEKRLRSVTLTFPDYDVMEKVQTARRLYQPKQVNLSADQYLGLIRRFTKGYLKFLDNPKVQSISEKLGEYNQKLKLYGLQDYQLSDLELGRSKASLNVLFIRLVYLILILILFLPGFIINAPVAFAAKYLALQEAKKAKKSSDVKLEGRDVIASYKLLVSLVLVPCLYTIETLVGMNYFILNETLVLIMYGFRTALFFDFVVIPILSYACVKMLEEGVAVWKSVIVSLRSITKSNYYEEISELRRSREELQAAVRELVEQLGPKVGEDFWEHRVIAPELIANESKNANLSLLKIERRKVKRQDTNKQLEEMFQDLPDLHFLNS